MIYYEVLFWGGGHALQFQHALLMVVAWLWIAEQLGRRLRVSARALSVLFLVAALPLLAVPAIYLLVPVGSLPHMELFAKLMLWGHPYMGPLILLGALRIVLEAHLGPAQLRVEALSGEWMPIDAPQWTRLGTPTAILGDTTIAGTEVFYPAGAARIVIGPLTGDHYQLFTPGHLPHARIAQLTQAFAPDPIHYDLVLDIEDLALPPGILGQRHLGEDLWLARSDHRGVKDRKIIPL